LKANDFCSGGLPEGTAEYDFEDDAPKLGEVDFSKLVH
jgi:hypothetical protein